MVRGGSFLTIVLRKSQQDLWVNLVDGLKEKEGLRMTAKFLSWATCRTAFIYWHWKNYRRSKFHRKSRIQLWVNLKFLKDIQPIRYEPEVQDRGQGWRYTFGLHQHKVVCKAMELQKLLGIKLRPALRTGPKALQIQKSERWGESSQEMRRCRQSASNGTQRMVSLHPWMLLLQLPY